MSKSGSQGMPRAAGQEAAQRAKGRFRRWFWGAITVMMVLTIALELTQARQLEAAPSKAEMTALAELVEAEMLEPEPKNLSAEDLERLLGSAGAASSASVKVLIPDLIDEAYAPVYDAVPVYAAYHYSVWGQYAELGAAALGDVGLKLEETLFDGLEARLGDVSLEIDDAYRKAFEAELAADPPSSAALGKLTRTVIADTRERMMVTAPVATSAVLGAALSAKLAVGAMTKSIAAKLAIKVAAKTGGKWIAAGSGAGAGAAVCS